MLQCRSRNEDEKVAGSGGLASERGSLQEIICKVHGGGRCITSAVTWY